MKNKERRLRDMLIISKTRLGLIESQIKELNEKRLFYCSEIERFKSELYNLKDEK